MKLLHDLTRTRNVSVLLVTHDISLIQWADRVIELHDGVIHSDTTPRAPQTPA